MDFRLLCVLAIFLMIIIVELILMYFRLGLTGIKYIFRDLKKPHPPYSIISNSKIKILVMGDSTATANGADQKTSIAARLASKYKASVLNLGESGSRTRNVIDQIDKTKNRKFDLIVLMTGNNDIVRFTNLKHLKEDIEKLVEKAKKKAKHVVILRGGNAGNYPFHPYIIRSIYTYRAKRVRDIFQKVAKDKKIIYVELFQDRKNDIFYQNQKKFYTPDLIHLNGDGYKVWFELLVKELRKNNVKLIDT